MVAMPNCGTSAARLFQTISIIMYWMTEDDGVAIEEDTVFHANDGVTRCTPTHADVYISDLERYFNVVRTGCDSRGRSSWASYSLGHRKFATRCWWPLYCHQRMLA